MNSPRTVMVLVLALTATTAAQAQTPIEPAPAVPAAPDAATGEPIEETAPPPSPPSAALAAPSPEPSAAARAEYRDNLIVFSEQEWAEVYVSGSTGRVDFHTDLHAMRGERREDIDGSAFYEIVGRPDLADSYRTRRKVRIGGLVVAGVGFVTSVYGLVGLLRVDITDNCVPGSPGYYDCTFAASDARDRESDRHLRTALVGLGLATIGSMVWRYVAQDPIGTDARRGLAAVYNRQLRERLGIPEAAHVEVSPYATSSGGGLAVSGQF